MVSGISTTTDTTAAAAAMKKATGMNKDDFLKLFVTQLQNQDPLNPQDGSQFIAQLAQLTQVEQSYNTNTNLQDILSVANNTASLSAVSFIGKDAVASGSGVNLQTGTPANINFNLSVPAQKVTVTISDAAGNVVKTLTQGTTTSGDRTMSWDGTNNLNQLQSAGMYNVSVNAISAAGDNFVGSTYVKGKVNAIKMDSTNPTVTVGGVDVPLANVISVGGGV